MGNERTWGVTPVPDRLRTLSLGDLTLLWGNLGVSLLVLVAGTYLAGLGLQRGLLAILVGAVLGCALLGLAGYIGAERRVPGMVLMREPLGQRGSYAPTVLNVVQNLGWATFELIVIAAAANALADRVFGFRERWVWVLAFGAITLALALAGPITFVRRYVRRFAIWAVAVSVGYLTWWALDGASTGNLWSADPAGGITFWQGVDLTVAMAASWLPLAADYTRFARRPRHAFWGTAAGYFVPLVWLYGLGALLFLSRGPSNTAALLTSVAAGGIASALALVALTVDETDEPFANVYSAAGVRAEPRARGVAAPPRPRRRRAGDRRRPRSRPRSVPELPVPARLLLRPALRRAGGRVPLRAAALRQRALERNRRMAGRCRPLPVDPADRPRVVGGRSRARARRGRLHWRRLPPRVRPRLRPLLGLTVRACANSASSGSSRWIALTAVSRASAARRSTRPRRCACSASRR